jgi:hypothetical protein
MSTEKEILAGYSHEELKQCLAEAHKYSMDLILYGQSVVEASSPFGRYMAAREAEEAQSVSPPEGTEESRVVAGDSHPKQETERQEA